MTTQPPTLTDFLLARIAEDEEVAAKAVLGPWAAVEGSSGHWWVEHPHTADIALDLHGENARHIARHHPARVLAECEAKRRIVEAYLGPLTVSDDCYFDGLEVAIQAHAAVYADHPEWREEWRP